PRRRVRRRHHQGNARRRVHRRAETQRPHDRESSENLTREAGARKGRPMEKIPILKISSCLLVTIQVDMHDALAEQLQNDLNETIVKTRATGVLIEISAL